MPRYEVESGKKVWLHMPNGPRMFAEGETFEFDGWPNAFMIPLDAEAKRVCALRDELRRTGQKLPLKVPAAEGGEVKATEPKAEEPKHEGPKLTPIPDNWRDLRPELIINLARQCGAPVQGTKLPEAKRWIEDELVRRTQAKAA